MLYNPRIFKRIDSWAVDLPGGNPWVAGREVCLWRRNPVRRSSTSRSRPSRERCVSGWVARGNGKSFCGLLFVSPSLAFKHKEIQKNINLNASFPFMRREWLLTVLALLIMDDEFDREGLNNCRATHHLLFSSEQEKVIENTSFWTDNFSLILFEWASVQMKLASTSWTRFKPLIFLRQSERSSLDSSSQATHGGLKYLF